MLFRSAAIKKAIYIFFAFAVGSGIVGYVIYEQMNPRVANGQPKETFARRLPESPNPMLQTNMSAKTDIMVLRHKEDEALYGEPTQNKDGSYRIPVKAAMAMIANGATTAAAPAPVEVAPAATPVATPAPTKTTTP